MAAPLCNVEEVVQVTRGCSFSLSLCTGLETGVQPPAWHEFAGCFHSRPPRSFGADSFPNKEVHMTLIYLCLGFLIVEMGLDSTYVTGLL